MKQGIDYTGITTVFLCHDGKGKYLLSKRSKNCRDEHEKWDCGGGGLDFGTKVEENLVKEIKEEYCADVLSFEFLGYRDVHRVHEGQKTHWIALDFKVLINPNTVAIGEPHKFDELKFFKRKDFPDKKDLHSQFPTFLEKYKEKI